MMNQNKLDLKKSNKHRGNISLVYPYSVNRKIAPNSIILNFYFEETFHRTMKVSQVFALMPVSGISSPSAVSLQYSFCSLRNFYTLIFILSQLVHAFIILYFNFVTGYTFEKMFPVIWFTVNPFVMYQFIKVARMWPGLMQNWESFENNITYRDANIHKQMRKIIFATSVSIPILACMEHLLSLGNNVNTASLCKNQTDTMIAYFTGAFPSYFYFFKVNYLNGISLQVLNVYATFAWSMTDAFIILLALGLITQFRHFNKNFERFKGMNLPPEFWGKQREYFTKLCELLDHVNKNLAVLILISFMMNTFYICVQLFQSIAPSESMMRKIYYWYSLIYLIGKTFAVTMTAALINDESKKPIAILESLPASAYGSEASRFMHQLTSTTIALGGMQFFYITRTFLISMAGTIVTYEIVLMQFKKPSETDFDPCKV